MKLKLYQVDAFTYEVFKGNPAAICPLDEWLSDEILQKIANENNLSETAFFVKSGDKYHIRWFTPSVEIELCGHATLAAAFVLFNYENHSGDIVNFISVSGELNVCRQNDFYSMNFPKDEIQEVELKPDLLIPFREQPVAAYKGNFDYMLIFEEEHQICTIHPNVALLSRIDTRGIIVTAPGREVDFVSRFFAPRCGIVEDPVTGSSHTTLIPYWAARLNKNVLTAKQLSKREGSLLCKLQNDRVLISGQAQMYMVGEIII